MAPPPAAERARRAGELLGIARSGGEGVEALLCGGRIVGIVLYIGTGSQHILVIQYGNETFLGTPNILGTY
jgi:hypothetical protein